MFTLLPIAWRNAILNWRHSLMAIVSIAAGFVSLSIFQNYMLAVQRMYEDTYRHRFMYGHLIVERKGTSEHLSDDVPEYELTEKEQGWLTAYLDQHRAEVRQTVRFLRVYGMITNGQSNTIFVGYGYDVPAGAELRKPGWDWNALAGVPLQNATSPNAVELGQSLGSILDCVPEHKFNYLNGLGGYTPENRAFHCLRPRFQLNVMTETGQANSSDAEVVGLMDAAYKDLDTKHVVMSIEMAQRLLGTKNLSYQVVDLKDGVDPRQFAADLESAAKTAGVTLEAMRWQDHPDGDLYVRTMSLLSIFRNFVVAVILVIAGLSVLNTMIKIVTERTREIGTLRSIGYSRNHVLTLFAAEAMVLSLIGAALGLVSSLGFSWAINFASLPYKAGMFTEPVPFTVAYAPGIYLASAVFLFFIAVFASVIPTQAATRRKISELLSHV